MGTAIFRVQGIKRTDDLKGIGKHNIDRISHTNMDIDHSRSDENITLKTCEGTYTEMFNEITVDLKKQHEDQMENTRKSRRKSFYEKINSDRADVACEFLLSASPEYFEDKSHEQIEEWAKASLEFVIDSVGIEKKNVLHAVVHMDEKTPHMHIVAVPLVEKYDGRKKQNVLAISRKHLITTKEDMSEVQTKYVQFMNKNGFALERGKEGSKEKHLHPTEYKEKVNLEKEIHLLEKNIAAKQEEWLAFTEDVAVEVDVSPRRELKKVEVRTEEKNLFGIQKKEIKKKPTGNVVISEKEFKQLIGSAIENQKLKGRMEKILKTDLAKENKSLASELDLVFAEWKEKDKENKVLQEENRSLRSQNSDLRQEIGFLYESTKEFLKERTEGLKAFKSIFKGFLDKVKEKVAGSEFERLYKREKARERDKGMEL